MASIAARIGKLEHMKRQHLRPRLVSEYSDDELRAVLIAAGINPDDDSQLLVAARGEL